MGKNTNEHGMSNLAYVESDGTEVTTKPNKITKVKPLKINEANVVEDEAVSCGYFGLPCPGPAQKTCLSAAGILFFLCWASTIQVLKSFVIEKHMNFFESLGSTYHKDTEPFYHSFMYSLVSLFFIITS